MKDIITIQLFCSGIRGFYEVGTDLETALSMGLNWAISPDKKAVIKIYRSDGSIKTIEIKMETPR